MPTQDAPIVVVQKSGTPGAAAQVLVNGERLSSPTAAYDAAVAQRRELSRQLESLEDNRHQLTEQIQSSGELGPANRTGLEQRLVETDKRIADTEKALATANQLVAHTSAVPGAVVEHHEAQNGPPEAPFVMGAIFMVVCVLPISLAFARRIWRRGATAVSAIPSDIAERFARLDQAVDSIAIEVERICEGQRFVTRVLSDTRQRAVGDGAPQPIAVPARGEPAAARMDERSFG
jgi:hypothetical protein